MSIKPTLSIVVKNTYFLMLIFGGYLYAMGIAYGQSSLQQHKLGWIERTVEYQQLNQIADREKRSDRWDILHALDNLASENLWAQFINFLGLTVVGTLLALLGFSKLVFVEWPNKEKQQKIDLEIKQAQLDSVASKSHSLSVRIKHWFRRQ